MSRYAGSVNTLIGWPGIVRDVISSGLMMALRFVPLTNRQPLGRADRVYGARRGADPWLRARSQGLINPAWILTASILPPRA